MPRDSSGTYTASPSSPFVTNTPISSSVANARSSDVATEITDSLSRTGKGGMLSPLTFTGIAATVKGGAADGGSAVGVVLDNATALANSSAKLVSIRNAGTEKASIDKDGGAAFAGTVAAPTIWSNAGGASLAVKGRAGDGATAVGVILDNANDLANAGAKLVSVRNNGAEKAYFDKDGTLYMGGSPALSPATAHPAWTTIANPASWGGFGTYAPTGTTGIAYFKSLGIVYVHIAICKSGGASAVGELIATLPEEYRPRTDVVAAAEIIDSGTGVRSYTNAYIASSGGVHTGIAVSTNNWLVFVASFAVP
jgi:hypothetical protein